jgi:preprotein translocase subunit SecF
LIALWVFGGEVIRDFVNAMIFGIVIGTYSSVYVASSTLMYFKFEDSDKRGDADASEDEAASNDAPEDGAKA